MNDCSYRAIAIALFAIYAACDAGADGAANAGNTATNNGTATTNAASNNAQSNNAQSNNAQSNNDAATNGETNGGIDCGTTEVVEFTTEDGVKLAADFHPADSPDRGAVVLLHMIPPNWDRTSYPPRVREALQALDLNVLNLDRRGAGDSEGEAIEAYEGNQGHFDVEAAVSFLLSDERSCAVDGSKLMLVGASNGTTSVLDYTVGRSDLDLPDPAAMVWLSPGPYTENQFEVEPQRARLEPIPILMIHPDDEPWAAQYAGEVDAWKVVEIPSGAHGTLNFDDGELEAQVLPELVSWAESHLAE